MGLLGGQAQRGVVDAGGHYVTRLFKSGMTQGMYDRALNEHYESGYRLSHIYEIGGSTVMVFERRDT